MPFLGRITPPLTRDAMSTLDTPDEVADSDMRAALLFSTRRNAWSAVLLPRRSPPHLVRALRRVEEGRR